MTGEKQSLDIALGIIFDSLLRGTHKITIGEVLSFDGDARTISVQPVLKRKFEGIDEPQLLPIIEDVPVIFSEFGGFVVEGDVVKGSFVVLLIADRSISKWLKEGGLVDPVLSRVSNLSDAIALPGLIPFSDSLSPGVESGALTIRKKDGSVFLRVKDDGTIRGENSNGFFELESGGKWNVNNNHTVDP